MRTFVFTLVIGALLVRRAAMLPLMRHADDNPRGRSFRELGLRRALASMAADSPGRAVVEALLARGEHEVEDAPAESPSTSAREPGLVDELERLASLRERGHLTEEEFDSAKRRLLTPRA